MSSSISSPKRGGAVLLKSFDDSKVRHLIGSGKLPLLLAGWILFCGLASPAGPESAAPATSKAATDRCDSKLKALENYAAHPKSGRVQTMQFSEEEVNSYLELDLSSQYHSCLKRLTLKFEEDKLQAAVTVDFDRLGGTSTRFLPKLLGFMLSGVHIITARGRLVSGNGKASFRLEQARFDNTTLPNALVEEIISAVGRKQNPPFDPLQPSQLFYGIQRIDVHIGYILVYQ